MSLTPLKYSPRKAGGWTPPGIYQLKPFDDSFIAGTLPSWLTVPAVTGQATEGATYSFGSFPGARSFLKVTSAAGAAKQAKLACAYSFDNTLLAGCLWELDGLKFDADNAIIAFGLAGSGGKGVYLQQTTTDTTAFLRWGAGAGSQAINLLLRSGGMATSVRNLKLFYNFLQNSVYVYVNDQCVGAVENAASVGGGAIQPDVSIISNGGSSTSVSLYVARARLTIWGNSMP
ncbi:hypothetical protein [uncultured Gordonia sp.]|uniref:hypothetical protein n=1 Tax=uncultured Gordonia sp. TaxID=198437 RepID=UPI00258A30E8|nr:hypothetical protein [uncultured Gordonia sp.]